MRLFLLLILCLFVASKPVAREHPGTPSRAGALFFATFSFSICRSSSSRDAQPDMYRQTISSEVGLS